MTLPDATYRIEVKDEGRWVPAPGEPTGWTRAHALTAISHGIPTMDGSETTWEGIRLINEQTGEQEQIAAEARRGR